MGDLGHKLEPAELQETWDRFAVTRDRQDRNDLVVHYTIALVRGVVARVASHLPVERDELVSYGVFGLMDAIEKFDPSKAVKFETYAATRIRGAILDEIRSLDWAPRTMRARARAIESAEDELGNELGRAPSTTELAEHLGLTVDDLHRTKTQVSAAGVVSLDRAIVAIDGGGESAAEFGMNLADHTANPATEAESGEILGMIAGAIDKLPTRSRTILALYYLYEMTLSEIGEVLGVTESRVCQLQSRLLQSLQSALSGELAAA